MLRKPKKKIARLGVEVKRCSECKAQTRPCMVAGQTCRFHGWVRYDDTMLQLDYFVKAEHREEILRGYHETGVMDTSGHIEKVRRIAALVEYPDGSVGRVQPELITFLDRGEV